jgi:hypothetical protein
MTARFLAAFALSGLLLGVVGANAALPTLHLNAVVYYIHFGKRGGPTSKERLYEGAKRVGEDFSRCAPVSKTMFHCVGSFAFARGTLQVSGTVPAGDNKLAITGGSGIYKGARGTVSTDYNNTYTKAKETLTFK